MTLNRRNFLRTSLSGAALAVGSTALASCSSKSANTAKGEKGSDKPGKDLELKLSFQEGIAPGESLNEKLDFMEKLGVVGFEPGGGGLASRVNEIKQALNGRNIKVSAICAGFKGFILSTDPAIRKECMDTMKEIIAAAGELGSTGVIIVPAFNGQVPALPHTMETRDFLCEQFNEMGTFAAQHGTSVIFEPLNRKECFYLRQVADAASLCRDINNPGVRCMGDFWHMTWEETSDMGAFISGGEYLQHVHVASRKRRSMPGEDGDADNYINGFKGLKMIGYNNYVSFECGCQGDRNVVVPAAVKLLLDKMPLVYPNMQLSEVVEEHPSLIPVINRFGIRLGLGDKSVKTLCEEHSLDMDFLLTVINTFLNEEYFPEKKLQTFHTSQIIDYLTKTNQYYLRYQLPNIERHLGSFISMSTPGNPTLGLIGRFFSSFKEELIARIEKDDKIWFPYCMSLSKKLGKEPAGTIDGLQITSEQRTEDTIEALLADLKSIMVKHLSGDYDENLCYAVLFSVCSLEKDIKQHNRIRYRILTPMVSAMEKLCI